MEGSRQVGEALQFILLVVMVFRSLIYGQLDSLFFLLLGLYLVLEAGGRFRDYYLHKEILSLFLGICQALAGILFFFVK